jgi:hypothetical protein
MSDEKRPTRLLAFRLRREGPARARAEGCDAGARELSARAEVSSEDAELSALLRAWDAPAPSTHARERLLSEFRATARRAPLWRRALSAELRVPLPVAACAALVLLASLFALTARTRTTAQASSTTRDAPAESAAVGAPTVKIVEVPVERERVVTRIVYVDKNAQQFAPAPPSNAAQRDSTARAAFARSDFKGNDARAVRTAFDAGARTSEEPTSYFTRVDMADFQPADEMKIRILKRGKTDEK